MKKILITLTMLLVLGTGYAFTGEINVSEKVLTAFKQDFNNAQEVKWTSGDDYYMAAFIYYNQHVFAFYSPEGDFYGITRYISSLDLPLHLLISLKEDYKKYWISDLFEVSKKESTSYFITLEDADTIIMLKASDDSGWHAWKKSKKS